MSLAVVQPTGYCAECREAPAATSLHIRSCSSQLALGSCQYLVSEVFISASLHVPGCSFQPLRAVGIMHLQNMHARLLTLVYQNGYNGWP
jgi:hypothetical protein